MGGRSPTDELRREHEAILAQVTEFASAIDRITGRIRNWDEVGAGIRRLLGAFRRPLLLHFRKEEEGLYPDVREAVSRGAPKGDILSQFFSEQADDDIVAHRLLRGRLRDVITKLDAFEQAGRAEAIAIDRLQALVHGALGLLQRHADREGTLVFPMIERLLPEDQMAAAADRIQAIAAAGP